MENFANTSTYFDPVCGMAVNTSSTCLVANCHGNRYWFCSEGCRNTFRTNPQKYLKPMPVKCKGWIGRHLELIAQATAE
jgi:YHS domain-containing protein